MPKQPADDRTLDELATELTIATQGRKLTDLSDEAYSKHWPLTERLLNHTGGDGYAALLKARETYLLLTPTGEPDATQ